MSCKAVVKEFTEPKTQTGSRMPEWVVTAATKVNVQEMSSWTDLLHSSMKLFEQTSPSVQFHSLKRNLDPLETLFKKLKAKTLGAEAPYRSIVATRLLAREEINAEQLARDLKSFEFKTIFKDKFPVEATSLKEYLQQVHEIIMISAIQEAQKDRVKSFNDYMLKVLDDVWRKENHDFLQSLTCISSLPMTNMTPAASGGSPISQMVSVASSAQVSSSPSGKEIPAANKPLLEKEAAAYDDVMKNFNSSRECGLPFKPATAFKGAYDSLGIDASGEKSVGLYKTWYLVQSHTAQASLGSAVGNLQRIRAFLQIRLSDYGASDLDAIDHRKPHVDTTWQQIYFCLRIGYYGAARDVVQSFRTAYHFAPLLVEWINTGRLISVETAVRASEECDTSLRMGDRLDRVAYDKRRLIPCSKKLIKRLLRDFSSLFDTIKDFLWCIISSIRDSPFGPSSATAMEGLLPYSLEGLQTYLNKFDASYYTKNWKDPLACPYIMLLSVQFLSAILYMSNEIGDERYNIDATDIANVLADYGLDIGTESGSLLGVVDAYSEASSMVCQYGVAYLCLNTLSIALEYYIQAIAAKGGGRLLWTGRESTDQRRQRSLMSKQLLTEVFLRDGGISFLLGSRSAWEEGELVQCLHDVKSRHHLLLEVARQCLEARLYDKSRAFSMALDTINCCFSKAIWAFLRGRWEGESQTAGLIHSGIEILETYKYQSEINPLEMKNITEQQTVLRQLEAILSIHKIAQVGLHVDVLREVARLSFLLLTQVHLKRLLMCSSILPRIDYRVKVPQYILTKKRIKRGNNN